MRSTAQNRRKLSILMMLLYVPLVVALSDPANATGPNLHSVSYTMKLPNGNAAAVHGDGTVEITTPQGASEFRVFPVSQKYDDVATGNGLPDKGQLMTELTKDMGTRPFADGRVVVVFRDGVSPSSDNLSISSKTLHALARSKFGVTQPLVTPAYTNDVIVNQALARMGVSKADRLFGKFSKSTLSAARSTQSSGRLLNFANAYRLNVTLTSVTQAVTTLLKLPSIAYASPDWIVGPMQSPHTMISQTAIRNARQAASSRVTRSTRSSIAANALPSNYAVSASAQSMLNAPSNNAVAALDEIQNKFHQLPGQGEIITNVSLGDLTDAGDTGDATGNCGFYPKVYGPTTHLINGQRYIDWPSMPLIAAYSADANSNLDGTTAVCGVDPQLTEIGLDFSMMAPLPHDLQRSGETGSGFGDLLGIAPGATYRLVVPRPDQSGSITQSALVATFLAAAQQTPRPNVITASLGFGEDVYGFPGRYLEDDPLTQAVIASIVQNYNVVVCISANDGTRLFTNAAIGPSGGSAPTQQIQSGGSPTDLNDVVFSTVPSRDFDSGSVDVGGTTLDDIFAAPPQNPQNARLASMHAFPETRWTGFTSFSSGFGSRVNLSAPSDNVIGVEHTFGGNFDTLDLLLDGGTSASAPQAAAAAAVALQVARLTGRPFHNAVDVRNFLAATGTPVSGVPQSDVYNNVGPQINVGHMVEVLLHNAGRSVAASTPRVAIEQRRNFGNLDGEFLSDTDPANIDLQGPVSTADNTNTDRDEKAWITIAPDWEGLPDNADFRLNVVGNNSKPLAITRWARLLPGQILAAAGLPLVSSSSRTVQMRYRAVQGSHVLAETSFPLTLGPADATTRAVLAPLVPPIVTGPTIAVSYNLQNARDLSNPTLVVSRAGRLDPATGPIFLPAYSVPLSALAGTVQIPVNKLNGGGVYGIGLLFGQVAGTPLYSDFAFTRVALSGAAPPVSNEDPRPTAPLLSSAGSSPGHFLELAYGAPMQVLWNVKNVPSATGALLEVSAPAPSMYRNLNPFNNPNGTIPDNNGFDGGSTFTESLSGTSGSVAFDTKRLVPGFQETVRVIPMRGGVAAGEGGDVSTVLRHGIVPSNGGAIRGGYSIDPNGTTGLLTAWNTSDAKTNASDTIAESFSQVSNSTTQVVAMETAPFSYGTAHLFVSHGWGYGPNLGIFDSLCDTDGTCPDRSDSLVNTATGTIASSWSPTMWCNLCLHFGYSALNSDIKNAPFLIPTDGNGGTYRLYTSNIPANTFSPPYDITAPLANCNGESYQARGFAVNTNTNMATAVFDGSPCGQGPIIITTTLANGSCTSFVGRGVGRPYGAAIDSTTNKLAVLTILDSGLSIYDMTANTSVEVTLPSIGCATCFSSGVIVEADPIHKLFVIERPFSENQFVNNNPMSEILVYDESGNLLKEIRGRINASGILSRPNWYYLQLNPSQRKGYFLTPRGQEIEPFEY